jgi:RNA polymerase sigma-70 factor (ECF subfamily)
MDFADEIVSCVPRLKSFARKLAGNQSLADDLVQETVLRALAHADQFSPGTNLGAWLSVILRNCYFNHKRTVRRLVSFDCDQNLPVPTISCPQESHLYLADVDRCMSALPAPQREALWLIAVNGTSYEAAADEVGCAVGTMKSRVSRARTELQNMGETQTPTNSSSGNKACARFGRAA